MDPAKPGSVDDKVQEQLEDGKSEVKLSSSDSWLAWGMVWTMFSCAEPELAC